ncbi:MAG: Nif3-like dinuclear metal center hexameric protein [Longimicrobiales bacterium]
MAAVKTDELVEYLHNFLRDAHIPDSSHALNGLQVANSGTVRKLAAAVDASEQTIEEAVRRGCDFLLVHHGLFWDGNQPVTGARYRKLKRLLSTETALYSAHIPLDLHPEVGNNAVLASAIGLQVRGTFGSYKGVDLGVWGDLEIRRESLAARLDEVLGGPVRMIAGGPEIVHRIGVVTGAAASMLGEAVDLGLDAFITGEGSHHTYFEAQERGINLYYGGHYATETWGVKALAAHLEAKFAIPWEFIDLPTGM